MQIIRGSSSNDAAGASAVGIGIFDGVHLGHQLLIKQVVEAASREGLRSVGYTFDPHPASVLNMHGAPKLIEPLEVRLTRLGLLGLSAVVIEPFTAEFAARSAEFFVREVLVAHLRARHVFIGADFGFGRGREGNVARLAAFGGELGFEVHPLEMLRVDDIAVSSTKIRELVWAGAVRGARRLLGRPFTVSGLVSRGVGRGSRIGFATANVHTENELLPAVGVYAAYAVVPQGPLPAVVNVGFSPTFGDGPLRIEAHLYDYAGGPLYGMPMSIEFIDRVRDEQRFANVEALKAQIRDDIATARALLVASPHVS
jgi:riboflavin kinase / FMN adenylyltransferase